MRNSYVIHAFGQCDHALRYHRCHVKSASTSHKLAMYFVLGPGITAVPSAEVFNIAVESK